MSNDLEKINFATERKAVSLLGRLCQDENDRNYGGFIDRGTGYADSRNSIYDAQVLFAAYLYPDFPDYFANPALLDKLLMLLAFMRNRQREDGSVGLVAAGVGGGSEVGFTLPGVCNTYRRVAQSRLPGRDIILETLEQYIRRGAQAVRRYWPHTSNHRWAAFAGPLAIVDSLFPNPANRAVIEEYVSDGIDIDSDGLFYEERSPNYNIVACTGLMYLADYWGRPDFLALIARNLEFSLLMRQPSDEAETLFSHRQDRGASRRPWGAYYLFKRLAVETENGVFAAAADILLERETAAGKTDHLVPLRYLLDDPRLLDEKIVRQPLPERFEVRFSDSPLWRYREKDVAATVAADRGHHFFDITQGDWGGKMRSDAFMSYHAGDAVIDAVKIRWGSGTCGFRPETIEYARDGSLRLDYIDPGWPHLAHYRPREKWGPRFIEADQNAHVEISHDSDGAVTLHIRIGGWEEMPVNIQFLLRENGRLRFGDGPFVDLVEGGCSFTAGGISYTVAGPCGGALSIEGLPPSEHRIALPDTRTITGRAEHDCHRLIAGLFTPVDIAVTLSRAEGCRFASSDDDD